MKRIGVLLFFILSALAAPLQAATTQLPNGMSCFSATTGINDETDDGDDQQKIAHFIPPSRS
jgi:hypothetical protein